MMMLGMLWIICIYGISILLVHCAHYYTTQQHRQGEPTCYTLISNHSQLQIEWSIRSLLLVAWLKGEALHITVVDQGSTDDTLTILNKLSSQQHPNTIHIIHAANQQPTYPTTYHL